MDNPETPVRIVDGDIYVGSPAGRAVVVGHFFDKDRGYRVALKFEGSSKMNSLSVEMARAVVRTIRKQAVPNANARTVADNVEGEADCCERLNAGWAANGRPASGFDGQVHGHA